MNISFDFTGRTVVVTGAAQGIGLGIARLFASTGGRVAVRLHRVQGRDPDGPAMTVSG